MCVCVCVCARVHVVCVCVCVCVCARVHVVCVRVVCVHVCMWCVCACACGVCECDVCVRVRVCVWCVWCVHWLPFNVKCMPLLTLGLQISMLRKRGLEFLDIPDRYYSQLRERLKDAKVTVTEPMDTVSRHLVSSCDSHMITTLLVCRI